jgi:hypothetical protein
VAMKIKGQRCSHQGRGIPRPCLKEEVVKMMKLKFTFLVGACLVLASGFCGYDTSSGTPEKTFFATVLLQSDAVAAEKPLAPEKNPPGDIPDNQVFVKYASSQGGYVIEFPEGWARTTTGSNVIFTDKFDGLSVTITNAAGPPNAESLRKNQAELLKKTGRAVRIQAIQNIKLSNGPALLMVYRSNSEPDPVVNKQVRLENSSYFYYRNGKLAELRLWAPLGADNVDQWNRVSNSFRWR